LTASASAIATILERPPIPPIATREDLIDALGLAAEIEHAIMCQYLYAAFSIDRESAALSPEHAELARTFVMQNLRIARQEMEHLGLVTNLLIAVGAAPDFDRPNLPIQSDYYAMDLPMRLLPFGEEFLALAARLEEPCKEPEPHEPLPYFPSVAAIYDRIRDGLHALGDPDTPTAATLYLGANDPQISNADFGAGPTQVWYDIELLPVTDQKSALAAIDLIRIQGEGASARDPDSHYALVCAMKRSWDALPPDVRVALVKPVPANPQTFARGDVDRSVACAVLLDPRALALARLANRAYELLLLLLSRLYGANDATAADRDMYRKYAFFPLMTLVVRPVGEILTELPAGDGEHCAVPTFELDGPIRTFPDRATFHVQLGERLSHLAAGFAAVSLMDGVPERMKFVAKNVAYVRDRVLAYIAGSVPP
jgi:hypothetical protein